MILRSKSVEFRTLGDSHFALMRSLLGDFNFAAMREADPYMVGTSERVSE
jgi:hypothetical protein